VSGRLRDDIDTGNLLEHLVDIGKNSSVEVSVLVALEAVHEGASGHFLYSVLDGFELALNQWVLPVRLSAVFIAI